MIVLRDYPAKQFYSEEEIEALRVPAAELAAPPVNPEYAKASHGIDFEQQKPINIGPAPEFNEADCGGAFDGRQVTSDADPGL